MSDPSKKSSPKTCKDTNDAISLLGLQDGNLPCNSQDGQMGLFGLDHAPVSPSHPPVNAKAGMMTGISGISGLSLSEFADRQRSLANRLQQRLEWDGSIEYSMTWRRKDTKHGRVYYQLAASGRRTSGADCSGERVDGWRSPQYRDHHPSKIDGNNTRDDMQIQLAHQAQMAGWTTPQANKNTPQQRDDFTPCLANQAQMAGWATPRVDDSKNNGTLSQVDWNGPALNVQAGLTMSGSPAPMESGGGVLNPVFVAWLMGFPFSWLEEAP